MVLYSGLEAVVTDAWISECLVLQRRLPEVHPVTQHTGAVQQNVPTSAGAIRVATLDGGNATAFGRGVVFLACPLAVGVS